MHVARAERLGGPGNCNDADGAGEQSTIDRSLTRAVGRADGIRLVNLSRVILAATLLFGSVAPAVAFPTSAVVATPSTGLELYPTEAAAQAHCPNDTVVWLNTASGIYHEKGMRWYGNTTHGAYVCRIEANAAGDRDTRNGQ